MTGDVFPRIGLNGKMKFGVGSRDRPLYSKFSLIYSMKIGL
jgi:hypothetical protein